MTKEDTITGKRLLENAYELSTPEDNRAYYRDFAETYDDEFAEGLGYSYPVRIAGIFAELCTASDRPVADIGCGTGLVAKAMPAGIIDGMDISPEMLEKAARSGCYRDLFEVDLTGDISGIMNEYGGVISAGTFTHGHLGPDALMSLLGIARQGALFVIGVNSAHMASHGFDEVMAKAVAEGSVRDLARHETRIYTRDDHEHSQDQAVVLTFRKA